jgi:hypothetical protein
VKPTWSDPLLWGFPYSSPPDVRLRLPVADGSTVKKTPTTPPSPCTFHVTVTVPVHVAAVSEIAIVAPKLEAGFAADAEEALLVGMVQVERGAVLARIDLVERRSQPHGPSRSADPRSAST